MSSIDIKRVSKNGIKNMLNELSQIEGIEKLNIKFSMDNIYEINFIDAEEEISKFDDESACLISPICDDIKVRYLYRSYMPFYRQMISVSNVFVTKELVIKEMNKCAYLICMLKSYEDTEEEVEFEILSMRFLLNKKDNIRDTYRGFRALYERALKSGIIIV